jgi:hypothetical protein
VSRSGAGWFTLQASASGAVTASGANDNDRYFPAYTDAVRTVAVLAYNGLHVVRLEHGAATANELARRLVVAPHREGGQTQFVPVVVEATDGGAELAAVQDWALGHLGDRITVAQLAARIHMAPRTFARWFVSRTGPPRISG